VVGFVVFSEVVQVYAPNKVPRSRPRPTCSRSASRPSHWPYGVRAGILVGIISALLWPSVHRSKLPPYLASSVAPVVDHQAFVIFVGSLFGWVTNWFNQPW